MVTLLFVECSASITQEDRKCDSVRPTCHQAQSHTVGSGFTKEDHGSHDLTDKSRGRYGWVSFSSSQSSQVSEV